MVYPDRVQADNRLLDLREQNIRCLDDVVVPYAKARKQSLQTTGTMRRHDVLVTAEQAKSIYALLQNQAPGQATRTEGYVQWTGLTLTVA